jgi:methionyl-tRNA synthetase
MNWCDLRNFINRVVVLTNKYYNGTFLNQTNFQDEATLTELKAYPAVISSSVERYRFREVELMNVARLEINIWLTKSLGK